MEPTKDKSMAAPSATARAEPKPVGPSKNASEDAPRTTGRKRKPKVVFDPSDNYICTRSRSKENKIICSVCKDVRPYPKGLSTHVVRDNWKCEQCEAHPEPIEEESSLKKESDEQAASNIKPSSLVANKPTKTAKDNKIKDESAKINCKVLSSKVLDEQDSTTASTSKIGKQIGNCIKTYSRLPKNQKKGKSSSQTEPGNDSKPTKAEHEHSKESYEVPRNNHYVVKDWTVDQVVKYVARHYPKDAQVFRDQDIDGAALLLLRRNDVVKGFGIKLGIALRLYELVNTLQNRSDDITLAWAN